ncbi:MAG: DUF1501 domain-containing protein [Rhodobacteraceae bacterium]|nr:DUF1501 domain-containing protein [Paracoccaceae bacterium]
MKNLQTLSRRKFLLRTAAFGCSAAASPFLTPITLAAAPWDNRLVVIILRGAMDGLDVIRPYGDRNFAAYRPSLSDREGTTDLDGFFALNKHANPLMPLWKSGELAFANAVATPYRDKRSHFDGQDMLEAGTGTDVGLHQVRDGWMNRMLAEVPGITAKTAFAVGRENLIILSGDAPTSSWSPNTRLDLSQQGKRLLSALYHDDPLFQEVGAIALEMDELMDMQGGKDISNDNLAMNDAMINSMMNAGRSARAKALARFTAERLNEETRLAAFSISGWDTHRTQENGIKGALSELSDAVLTLKQVLGANWQKTAVIAITEFGRTARENGTRGTDHGTGGAMLMAGGAIRGGKVYGNWPGLGESDLYQNRDLMPTADVRAYAADAMHGLFGLDRNLLQRVVFPGLDMGEDRGILL